MAATARPAPSQSANTHPAQPPTDARLRTCTAAGCGAYWLDYDEGRDAHKAVFGHPPTTQEDPCESAR